MSLGLSNLTNHYLNNMNQQSKVTGQGSTADFSSVLSSKRVENTAAASASKIDQYTEYLNSKYGNVIVQSVEKDQGSMDALGTRTSGMNNIVIAPNILEEMANDPDKAAYYEEKIQYLFDSQAMHEAQLTAGGFEMYSRGMVIHPDGTVTYYICGDVSPEKKAKTEAAMKAERDEKEERRQEYLELGQEAAEERKRLADLNDQKQILAKALNVTIISAPDPATDVNAQGYVASAISAYKDTFHTFSENFIKKV